jgi:hypothetical protein
VSEVASCDKDEPRHVKATQQLMSLSAIRVILVDGIAKKHPNTHHQPPFASRIT